MTNFVYIFFLLLPVCKVLCGNILIFHFIPPKSFMTLLDSIVYSLAPNHKITLYSYYYTEFPHPNVSVVHVNVPPIKSSFSIGTVEDICQMGLFKLHSRTAMYLSKEYIETMLSNEKIKQLFTTKEKYDLLLVPSIYVEYLYQFATVLQVPIAQISPNLGFRQTNDAVGNPIFMTTVFNYVHYGKTFNFFNRINTYLINILFYYYYYTHAEMINSVSSKYFPPGTPSYQEINLNTSLVISNVNGVLGYVKPNMPHVLEIGGLYCRPPKALSSDLDEFIAASGEHGIIYASFGVSIGLKYPEYVTKLLVKVFAQLPQRILWKWDANITNLPSNVRVGKQFPQQDILGHNKTKLFITQGGLLSLQETIYHGVPVLAFPIAFDQPINAVTLQQIGYGEYINFCEISEGEVLAKIISIIANSKYKTKIENLSKLLKEDLATIDERLNNAVNYVIRHKGNPIIQQLPYRASGFQRMDVDIVLMLMLICQLLLIFVVYIAFKLPRLFLNYFTIKPHLD